MLMDLISLLEPQANDDVCDRLNYYYTTTFLMLLSVLVSFQIFYGTPIECWAAAEFKASWTRYGGKSGQMDGYTFVLGANLLDVGIVLSIFDFCKAESTLFSNRLINHPLPIAGIMME